MLGSAKDPLTISFSTQVYQWLLTLYPARFHREYGPQMLQVFRDYSLKTYAESGPPGMLWLWGLTLFDLFKTLIEEHLQKETFMSNAKFIRFSGWAMLVGSVLAVISDYIVPYKFRAFLFRTFKIVGTPQLLPVTNAIKGLSLVIGFMLITLGILGLLARYGDQVAKWGKTSLQISLLCMAVISILLIIGTFNPNLMGDNGWIVLAYGALGAMIFMSIFGAAILRSKPLPYWNALPLALSLPAALWFLITLAIPNIPANVGDMGYTFTNWWVLLGFALLGYILQSDASGEVSTQET